MDSEMAEGGAAVGADWPNRWSHVQKLVERKSPLHEPDFEPSPDLLPFLRSDCRVLVIGAGGLGCELLKDLALVGFGNLTVIDMDTIDLSNLNRQFLFRPQDIGRSKAQTAADFIVRRVRGVQVRALCCPIQDMDADFYASFHLIVCGLDSIAARRWISGLLLTLLSHDPDSGHVVPETMVPLVDGGTEGLKGSVRLMTPGLTACTDCTLHLFPPAVTFPLCTIAHTPRLPEHCVEYVRLLLWPKDQPFGPETRVDGDDPNHVSWIYEQAVRRADEFHIPGLTYRLTQGVIKRIIPAVASTNAVIAAACATEALKLATSAFSALSNYMLFSDVDGVHSYSYAVEKRQDCVSCSRLPQSLTCDPGHRLQDIVNRLKEQQQLRDPGLSTVDPESGKNRNLFMPTPDLMRQMTAGNLKLTLTELRLVDGQDVFVNDATTPVTLTFKLKFQPKQPSA